MTAVADVSKGQTDMSYKAELQTLTKQNMDTKSVLVDSCHTTISESAITMLISRNRSNYGPIHIMWLYIINFHHNTGSIHLAN